MYICIAYIPSVLRALFSKFQMFLMNKMSTEAAYVCEKCNYTTKVKSSFIAHTTKRKIPCDAAKTRNTGGGAEAKQDAVTEATHEPVVAEAKSDAKSEPMAEAKPEPVADAKPEPMADAKPEPMAAEAKPEPMADAKPEPMAAEAKPAKELEDPRTRQIVINCVKLETVNRLHDAIYLFDECLKRPDPDANILQRKQFKTLTELVQIYHELIASLQYREAAVQSLTRA